jgi:hypothetical protein
MHHKETSLLMSRVVLDTAGETSSKTHALHCFHKHHEMSTTRELYPGQTCLDTLSSATIPVSCLHLDLECIVEVLPQIGFETKLPLKTP